MRSLGWDIRRNKKGIYFDGHGRADVIAAREKYLATFEKYSARMSRYDEGPNNNMGIRIGPTSNESEIILVTHDESTFHANDDNSYSWVENGKGAFYRKNRG